MNRIRKLILYMVGASDYQELKDAVNYYEYQIVSSRYSGGSVGHINQPPKHVVEFYKRLDKPIVFSQKDVWIPSNDT